MSKLRFTIGSFLGLFLDGVITAAPGAVLPQWTAEFDVDKATILFFNCLLLGSLLGISLAARIRHRHPLMSLAFGILGIAFLMAAKSPCFTEVLIATVLIGFGNGVLNLQANSLVGELHAKRRVAMLNLVNIAFGLGAVSAPVLVAFLSWRTTFTIIAIPAALATVFVWKSPPVHYFTQKSDKMPWRHASIPLLMILLYTGLEGALGTWSGIYLAHLGRNAALTGTLLSLYWSCLTLGRMLLVRLVAQHPLKFLPYLLVGALGVLVLNTIPAFAILFPLAAFFYGPLFAILFAVVQERCSHVALGYLFYASLIGITSVPAAFSLIDNPTYLPYGFIFLALLLYLLSYRLKEE